MSSLAFVAHPSVRIKGSENAYTPQQCLDERCPVKAPHLHCPFCVKTDAYQDPVILKAHYRVKHVDKGIEFAGLKILRCCDHCEIVGIIKGEKRFKGAHWHCYRCRNGFNRRDEAIKHYKTHFRNPQTTFQIQITQDLNSPPSIKNGNGDQNLLNQPFSYEHPSENGIPAPGEHAVITSSSNGKISKLTVNSDTNDKGGAVEESGDHQTIMIIQGDQLDPAFTRHILDTNDDVTSLAKTNIDSLASWEIRLRIEQEEKNVFKAKAEDYKEQIDILQQQVADLESQLQLSQQIQMKLESLSQFISLSQHNKERYNHLLDKILRQLRENPESLEERPENCVVLDNAEEEQLTLEQVSPSDTIGSSLDHHTIIRQINNVPDRYQVLSGGHEGHVLVSDGSVGDINVRIVDGSRQLLLEPVSQEETQTCTDIYSTTSHATSVVKHPSLESDVNISENIIVSPNKTLTDNHSNEDVAVSSLVSLGKEISVNSVEQTFIIDQTEQSLLPVDIQETHQRNKQDEKEPKTKKLKIT